MRELARGSNCLKGQACKDKCLLSLTTDPDFALCEHSDCLNPSLLVQKLHVFKAKAAKDPDAPSFHEAVFGPHREKFIEAMRKETKESEAHGTWQVVHKDSIHQSMERSQTSFQPPGSSRLKGFQVAASESGRAEFVLEQTRCRKVWIMKILVLQLHLGQLWGCCW